jgi:hypothetical protein
MAGNHGVSPGAGIPQEQAKAANEQARIAQQGHVTERFSQAVEHLGRENLSVRLGGIYALWRLITDSPEDVLRVLDVLCAFVRHPPPEPAAPQEPKGGEAGDAIGKGAPSIDRLRPDVQAVLDMLGDAEADYRQLIPADYRLDLRAADLAHAGLRRKNFSHADFTVADLTQANFEAADLTGADFTGANLTRAFLVDANLDRADLGFANISGARFHGAKHIPDLTLAFNDEGSLPVGLPDNAKRVTLPKEPESGE